MEADKKISRPWQQEHQADRGIAAAVVVPGPKAASKVVLCRRSHNVFRAWVVAWASDALLDMA
jgi:hypothetical protein